MTWHLGAPLVIEALEMAVRQRRPDGMLHHSDHGCHYTSVAFGVRCRAWGVAPSEGWVGDCYDNAMAESFFATLECEWLDRTKLKTHAEARAAAFEFIEGWYSTRRRHSALGYLSPLAFVRRREAGPLDGARAGGRPPGRWIPQRARAPHRPEGTMFIYKLRREPESVNLSTQSGQPHRERYVRPSRTRWRRLQERWTQRPRRLAVGSFEKPASITPPTFPTISLPTVSAGTGFPVGVESLLAATSFRALMDINMMLR